MHVSVGDLIAVAHERARRLRESEDALGQAQEMLDEARSEFGRHSRAHGALRVFLRACMDDLDTPFQVRDDIRRYIFPQIEDTTVELGGES